MMDKLPIGELINIMVNSGVLKIMAKDRKCEVTIDYLPPSNAIMIPRDEQAVPLESYPRNTIPVTFTLAEAMFGGEVFVAITCGHRVVVNPFKWKDYDMLESLKLRN